MKFVIDRFEGDKVILELPDRSTDIMPKRLLDPGAREGDVLEIRFLSEETVKRATQIQALARELWKDN